MRHDLQKAIEDHLAKPESIEKMRESQRQWESFMKTLGARIVDGRALFQIGTAKWANEGWTNPAAQVQ